MATGSPERLLRSDRRTQSAAVSSPPCRSNPLEFGLPPNTLEVTDVLQLLSLVVARDVPKDAGADHDWYDATRTGAVLGVTGANQLTQPLTARLQTPVLKEVVRSCGLGEGGEPRTGPAPADHPRLAPVAGKLAGSYFHSKRLGPDLIGSHEAAFSAGSEAAAGILREPS
ncbi:hypothetical protein [Streptomyces sp. NPDC008240]|uniref:hypothetical protein n=1 Tax=Streptomyces sp. NPDC008240 TaxID=3364822 RepID=UPI0036E7128C